MSQDALEMLMSMEKLLTQYQKQRAGENSLLQFCPLCHSDGHPIFDCINCPWVIETGKKCDCVSRKYSIAALRWGVGTSSDIPKQTLTKWRKRRIKELTEWLKH